MADKREEILERLLAIVKTVDGVKNAARNRASWDQDERTAVAVMDGSESVVSPKGVPPGRGPQMANSLVDMSPEIYLLPQTQGPQNDTVGTLQNTLRLNIINAIGNDAELKSLLGSNGMMAYAGCDTDLRAGGALHGLMRLDFKFRYTFKPD